MHRAPVAAVAFVGLTFCQAEAGELGNDDATEHALYYELSFDTAAVARDAEGFTTTTNLGYAVRLRDGWLSTQSAELVPCAMARLRLGSREAHAGHFAGDGDPSQVVATTLESLTAAGSVELGASLSNRNYCALGFSVAPNSDDGVTLTLDLSVALAGGWTDRQVTSSGSYERQIALTASFDSGAYSAKIVIERKLATMFDDIAFQDAPSDAVIADQVLRNLLSHAEPRLHIDN